MNREGNTTMQDAIDTGLRNDEVTDARASTESIGAVYTPLMSECTSSEWATRCSRGRTDE